MRGFLVNKYLVEIAQLDALQTEADPDGAGILTSGYDDDFKETIPFDQPNAAGTVITRETTRKENTIFALAQVDTTFFERLQQLRSGNSPDLVVELTFHISDLECRELINSATGDTTIKVDDRLVAIRDCDGALIQTIPTPPGLYATHVRPSAFMGRDRNLFVVTFEDRQVGV